MGPPSIQWMTWWAAHHWGGRPQSGKVQPLSLAHSAQQGWGDQAFGSPDVQGLALAAQDHGDDCCVAGELADGLW